MSMRAPRSLQSRLLLFAFAGIAVALILTGLAISALFERHLSRRIGSELDAHLAQIAGNLAITADRRLEMQLDPADPRFERIFSGLYWQVRDEASGTDLRSVSLWDDSLALPTDQPAPGEIHVHNLRGPAGETLLVHERRLLIESNGVSLPARMAVGISRAELDRLRDDFRNETMAALAILGLLMFLGLWFQVRMGLAPLARLRDGVATIRTGPGTRLGREQPEEVLPLVDEINTLVSDKEKETERARNRAADLAHGLKTPLTVLAADIRRLREKGEDEIANDIAGVAKTMQHHVERQLARARARNDRYAHARTDIRTTVARLIETVSRTPGAERLEITSTLPPDILTIMSEDDFNDVVGNLLENAVRKAVAGVRISVTIRDGQHHLSVDDDGPGVPSDQIDRIVQRGTRLDQKGSGAGLGLAIANDILDEYGLSLLAGPSDMGGLRIGFTLP
ncbi:MAG: HAMP domain-containing sensor histidine kinase [Rhizobiaceae bacterium]